MRNTLRSAFVALCLLYAWEIPESKADSLVVATCGTLPLAYAPGATRLDTVDITGKLCTNSSGGGGGAVTIADGADVAEGSTTDAACGTDNGTCTLAAVAKRIAQRLTTINTTLGAAPMQATGGTVTANAGTNLNTSALALDTSVGTTNTDLGPPGATACATDTGSCSLNALLQRLAQRLTTLNTTLNAPFQAGGALAANQSVNVAQVNGSTTVTAATGVQKIGVVGNAGAIFDGATGAAVPANAVQLGGRAQNAEATAVSNGQLAPVALDLVGKQIMVPYANPENFVSGVISSAMTGTTSTSLVASPGGSLRNYITNITCSNSHATVGTDIIVQDGSGGTTLYVIPTAPAFGGASITFPVPLRQPTTATALFVANVTTGSNTKCSATGYKGI